jgi:hypothetical protein
MCYGFEIRFKKKEIKITTFKYFIFYLQFICAIYALWLNIICSVFLRSVLWELGSQTQIRFIV